MTRSASCSTSRRPRPGSPRAPSRPIACCASSTGSACRSARRATIRKRPSRRRRRKSARPRQPKPPKPPSPRKLRRLDRHGLWGKGGVGAVFCAEDPLPYPPPRSECSSDMTSRLIAVGIFGAPQGVRGEVRVKSYTAEPKALGAYGELADASGARRFKIVALRPLKDDMVVVRLDGVADRDAAAKLTGVELFAR